MTDHRDAITGQFVTADHAAANPDTTVSESPCRECERLRGVVHTLRVALDGANARIGELTTELAEAEYAARGIRAYCEAFVEESEDPDPEPWNPAAYVLSILDGADVTPADGQPAVRTVGDLTARHIGKRVRVGKTPPATLAGLSWREVGIRVHLVTTDAEAVWQNLPLNTPVEVLG